MNIIYSLFDAQTINNVVITLSHSLWQGIFISVGLWIYLNKSEKSKARVRYAASFFSMLILVALVILTFSSVSVYNAHAADITDNGITHKDVPISSKAGTSVSSVNAINAKAETMDAVRKYFAPASKPQSSNNSLLAKFRQNWEDIVFALYLIGVFIMTIRVLVLLGGAYKLKSSTEQDHESWRMAIFDELARKMKLVGKVVLAVSDRIVIPCTIGFIKPVILLPASILAGLDETQLRAILAHELTHIKRYDWLFSIVQMFIEAMLFFNPAMWWISRQIRLEREAVCDEGVVGQTSKPMEYAKLLLEFARLDQKPAMAAALGLKFSSGSQSPISERIKRLIIPGHRSASIRPGIVPAIIIFFFVTLAFCSFQKGTETTLEYIGRYLSPQERTEAMARINEEYSAETGFFTEDEKIIVRGQLVTVDGNSLPLRISTNCQDQEVASVNVGLEVRPDEQGYINTKLNPDGTFEFETRLKRFYIIAKPKSNYAISFFGPFEFDPAEIVEGLLLPLDPGFTSNIKFIDEQGNPVSGVNVAGGYPDPPDYNSCHYTIKSTSTDDGIAVIKNSADESANFRCEAAGYVKEARNKIRLSPDQPYVWQLTSTPATKIQVVSDVDSQPISSVAVNLHGKEYWQISSYGIDRPVNTTDDDGQIELKSLDQMEDYTVLIHFEGYQRQYLKVRGGDEIIVRLKEFMPVKGKITGDLSSLKKDEKGSYFEFSNIFRAGEHSIHSDWSGENKVYVELVDDEAHFQIDKYYGHELRIKIGSKQHKIDIDEDDISNVIIDFPLPSSYKKRNIVFNFVNSDGSANPQITGKFKLSYKDNPGVNSAEYHEIDISGGKAEVEIAIPNRISWSPTPKAGWFFYYESEEITIDHSGSKTIKCYPAGAIFGKITNPSEELSRAHMGIHIAKKSPLLDKNRHGNLQIDFKQSIDLNPDGSYYIAPVPLGGKYAISLSTGNLYWLSNDIKLSEKKPICELNISLPADLADITGHLLDPEGNPVSGASYMIYKSARHGGGAHRNDKWSTDSDGRFELTGVNPDTSVKHSVSFDAPGFIKKKQDIKIEGANRIVLERALIVTGTVFDKDTNEPASGVTINFWPEDRGELISFKVRTDSKGRFTAHQFADAEYRFGLQKDGYPAIYRSKNRINPSKDNEVELYIQKKL